MNETLQSDLLSNIQKELDARKHLDDDHPYLSDSKSDGPQGVPQSGEKWWTIPEFHWKN